MINMPDSIYPGNIPMGYPAVLGYSDGAWPTAPRLAVLFPGARRIALTVTAATTEADGIDCEPGNPNAASAADWIRRKLAADPGFRPVAYADLASPGYSMGEVLTGLAHLGIGRGEVRLLTAHYDGEHICSPSRGCRDANGNVIAFTADGTQWTSTFPGVAGAAIDMSLLSDEFFGALPVSTGSTQAKTTEEIVQQLPVLKQGATGAAVRRVQGLLVAAGYDLGTSGAKKDGIDGSFGGVTATALRAFQAAAHIGVDGVVGPAQTWPALLGV